MVQLNQDCVQTFVNTVQTEGCNIYRKFVNRVLKMKQFCSHAISILNFLIVGDRLIVNIFPTKLLVKRTLMVVSEKIQNCLAVSEYCVCTWLFMKVAISILKDFITFGPGFKVIKPFSSSTQLSMKFIMLMNVKMPSIVGI